MKQKKYHEQITREELDSRDLHMGIRKIKTDYQPVTYHFKDGNENIRMDDRAEFAA